LSAAARSRDEMKSSRPSAGTQRQNRKFRDRATAVMLMTACSAVGRGILARALAAHFCGLRSFFRGV
jgi:hypothetical protein